MKTRVQLYKWLLRAALMLVALTGSTVVMADDIELEGGEAFYVYQNDGHFNGFFYDQVKEIRYSRLDTLGREHPYDVSQEIVTEDSVYRIMLTAIDSVSFVQPEIKYAEGVRKMSEEGLMDYFVSYSPGTDGKSHTLVFSSAMPESLKPKVGQVLTCLNVEGYEGAFVYKVTKVYTDGGQTVVDCGYVKSFDEVFEQFVTVEQLQQLELPDGSRSVRRRMAGIDAPKRAEGNWSANLFSINKDFENNFYLAGGLANDKVGLKLGLKFHLGFGMTANVAYKFKWGDFMLHCEMREMIEVGFNATVDGSLSGEKSLKDIPGLGTLLKRFTRIPFPAQMPVLNLNVVPEPIIRGELHFVGGFSTGVTAKVLKQSFTLRSNPNEDRGEKYLDLTLLSEPGDRVSADGPSLYLEINGSAQLGVKFPILLEEQEWMGNFLSFTLGYTVYAGPKLTGNVTFDVLKGSGDLYAALNKAKVSGHWYSVDGEAISKTQWWGSHVHEKKWTQSFNMYGFDLNLFPEISKLTYDVSGNEMNEIKAHFYTKGDTFWPQYLGVALYGKANDKDERFTKLYKDALKYEMYFMNTYNDAEVEIKGIEGGDYKLRPVIQLKGFETLIPIYDMEQDVHIGRTDLLLEPDNLTVEEEGGEVTIALKTGHPLPVQVMPYMDWATAKVNYVDDVNGHWARSITVKVEPNDDGRLREDSISVWMVHDETKTIQKSLKIRQYGGLQLDPTEITFEAEGGEIDVDVLSSYKPITIDNKADWLFDLYYDEERKLSLNAKKNDGAERTTTVIVAGWNPRHEGISQTELKVTQKGLVDVTPDKEELAFEANGGGGKVNVKLGGNYTFSDIVISKDGQEWLTVEQHSDYFIINAMPNTSDLERETTITLVFKKSNASSAGPDTYKISFKIKQKAAIAKVDKDRLHFFGNGGSDQVKIDFGIYPYCGAYVNAEGDGWCSYDVAADGTVTVTVEKNESAVERECILVCYVSGKPDPKDNEMVKMPVTIVQDGATIIPDGDNSPFKMVNFWMTRKIAAIVNGDEDNADTADLNQQFTFKPDNSHFTLKRENGYIHVECEGLAESSINGKTKASLKFDIYGSDKTVRNLQFRSDTHSTKTMSMLGYDINMSANVEVSVATGDIPLSTYTPTYMERPEYKVTDGLTFTSFSGTGHMVATYKPTTSYNDPMEPTIEDYTYVPIGDSGDFIDLRFESNVPLADLEWPSSEAMTKLKDDGMPIAYGDEPPTLSGGTYLMSPLTVVTDRMDSGEELADMSGLVLKFGNQQAGTIDVDFYFVAGGEAGEVIGMTSLIQGSNGEFTICVPYAEMSIIISGRLTGQTITDLHFAILQTDAPGIHCILKDSDGTSLKTTWSPPADD